MISGYSDISQVIYEACERLGISNSEAYEMRFLRLILDAEKKIGTGLISGTKVNLYEPGAKEFENDFSIIIPFDLIDNLLVLDIERRNISECDYSVFGTKIIFKEKRIEPVILQYNGIIFDINNNPVISYNHFEAVVSFLVFMETTTRYHSKKATYTEFQDARAWWQDRLGEARGNDAFPSYSDIKEASGALHSVKMYLENGLYNCDTKLNITKEYKMFSKVTYGFLPLNLTISSKEDYTSDILINTEEIGLDELQSDDFYLDVKKISRFTIIIPYNVGLINSLKDSNNNEIFENFFNIIKDDIRQITIYTAKEFLTQNKYKLKFGFSK